MDTLAVLITVGILLGALALFVAAEFSLVSVEKTEVAELAESGDRAAADVLRSLRSLSTQLSGAQVGITITSLGLGFIAEPAMTAWLTESLFPILRNVPISAGVRGAIAVGIGMLIVTIVTMVIGELVPQNLALSRPMGTARWVARPHYLFTRAVGPLVRALSYGADALLLRMGIEPQEELRTGRSTEELAAMVQHSADAGVISLESADLLTRSLWFGERTAADVMTPRTQVHMISAQLHASDVIDLCRETGHSRFPVRDGDSDSVVGLVHLKAALSVPRGNRTSTSVRSLMSPIHRVPETIRLDPLLTQLRSQGQQLALAVDEYDGTAGIVTLEDLIEEIVGDVQDEHDQEQPQLSGVYPLADGSWSVPGRLRPDEVRDSIAIAIPDGPLYETVAGYFVTELGYLPSGANAEEAVSVQGPGFTMSLEAMDGLRVERVRLVAHPSDDTDDRQVNR